MATTEVNSAQVVEPASDLPKPPYDPTLVGTLNTLMLPDELDLGIVRQISSYFPIDNVLKKNPHLLHTEHIVDAPADSGANPEGVTLSVFRSSSTDGNRPCLYNIHGGGQISGNRFMALELFMDYFEGIDAVTVSVEYRLAPEHPAPAGLNDCYAGLVWVANHADELGIDPAKIIICGGSGGAPLAVGSALLARNNSFPSLLGQMILTPMLDDRGTTVSSQQFYRKAPWSGHANKQAWDMVLGSRRGGPDVSELEAPARATDLSNLPPTFVDAAECEVFRDEAVAFASKLWASGSTAELHIWPGAYHGFDMLRIESPIANASIKAKQSWVKRLLEASADAKAKL
ncbi:Carboxylesterase NlhH [Paramyrothecium foliicola]|nr:Carboxylesterase NlhH [Paramyrothecium foliicola]